MKKMKSRYIINFALLVFILGLYWFLNQSPTTPQQGQTLTTSSQSDIHKIILTRNGLDSIILEKISENWQLTQPIQAPANATRVKLLLSLLNTFSYAQLAHADDDTLNQLGINNTSSILQLDNNTFQFGDIEAISKRRYVLHNDRIHLIDDNVMPLLNASAASFIENKLIATSSQITKLSLPLLNRDNTTSTENITIENNEGHWTSENSTQTTDQLTILVDAWQHAYALQVLPIEKAKLPATESYKIMVWLQSQEAPIVLDMQTNERTLFLTKPSQQLSYQFPISLMQQLLPTAQ